MRRSHAQAVRPAAVRRHPYRLRRRPEERVKILGATMDLVKSTEVFNFIARRIAAGERAIVANHNLQSLGLIQKDPELRRFFDAADLVEVDSVPLLVWARLMGRRSRLFHRCTYLDWRDEFWSRATEAGWRVFILGGAEGVAETACTRIRADWPQVELASRHGYFDAAPGSAENAAVLAAIRAFRPDVLFVGMGMPRQELWIGRHLDALPPCAILTVGGAFDYEAGVQVPAPRWVGRLGAEWLFRLALNPRRLFRRYLLEPWILASLVWRDLVQRLAPAAPLVRPGPSPARHAGLRLAAAIAPAPPPAILAEAVFTEARPTPQVHDARPDPRA
jgi:N-acetylglucosaminyldiphosphoundecaprenol N-acetyl-beta-D-mannosaminyltransferase